MSNLIYFEQTKVAVNLDLVEIAELVHGDLYFHFLSGNQKCITNTKDIRFYGQLL